jgi:hypothetical protein
MAITKREKEKYRQAFNRIIGIYLEFRSQTGTLSCTGLYKSIGRQAGGKAVFNSSVIKPTPSDFVCEIELIISKYLDEFDLQLFCNHYLNEDKSDHSWRNHKHRIQEILGRVFIIKNLHPVELYFKSRDIR